MENNKRIENAKNQLNDLKQMVYLIYRNYRDRDTQMLSIALTYYSGIWFGKNVYSKIF